MAKKSQAQRAAKKHQKEKDRQKKLARRKPPLSPEERWKPLLEGVEGLARRLGMDEYMAFEEIEFADPPFPHTDELWTPARLREISTGDLLERLEALGITTDAESFAERALIAERTLRFSADDWLPIVAAGAQGRAPEQEVHDRDFVRAANIILWERWLPDHPSNEELESTFDWILEDYSEASLLVHDLLMVWDRLGQDAAARLGRTEIAVAFTEELLHAAMGEADEGAHDDNLLQALDILTTIVPRYAPTSAGTLKALRTTLDENLALDHADPADTDPEDTDPEDTAENKDT